MFFFYLMCIFHNYTELIKCLTHENFVLFLYSAYNRINVIVVLVDNAKCLLYLTVKIIFIIVPLFTEVL